jgi:hypothetical protein
MKHNTHVLKSIRRAGWVYGKIGNKRRKKITRSSEKIKAIFETGK